MCTLLKNYNPSPQEKAQERKNKERQSEYRNEGKKERKGKGGRKRGREGKEGRWEGRRKYILEDDFSLFQPQPSWIIWGFRNQPSQPHWLPLWALANFSQWRSSCPQDHPMTLRLSDQFSSPSQGTCCLTEKTGLFCSGLAREGVQLGWGHLFQAGPSPHRPLHVRILPLK